MIYFDNAATTRPLPAALDAGKPYLGEFWYNPSALYRGGRETFQRLAEAHRSFVSLLGSAEHEAMFTSCGSESDNAAIFSAARRGNAVTTAGEHAAVYQSFAELKNRGIEPRFARLNADGSVDAEHLLSLVDEGTSLVSVVHVNNETGAINDVAALARAVKKKNPRALFHSDGVQAFGKIPFRLTAETDFYAVSAHKIGGLKGTGALYRKKSASFHPFVVGGGQEDGKRSGTENVYGIKVFEAAANFRCSRMAENYRNAAACNALLRARLNPDLFRILSPASGSPYILGVSAAGVRGEVVMHMLEESGFVVGTGSACSSRSPHSRVLAACGYGKEVLDGALRVSFCPESDLRETEALADAMNEAAGKLKKVMKR